MGSENSLDQTCANCLNIVKISQEKLHASMCALIAFSFCFNQAKKQAIQNISRSTKRSKDNQRLMTGSIQRTIKERRKKQQLKKEELEK